MTLWAKIVSALLGLIKPLVYFFVYQAGRKSAATEIENRQLKAEQERIRIGKEARNEAEQSDSPDPYLRD